MYTGSNIVKDSLFFGYDTYYGGVQGASTRFYKGEPTVNKIPSPEKNGRFAADNTWGSYNTNQYNSNNDFDIGTIGSVSNNIVTLSSVGHVIRSFDVLNPATTGGGVTAGTNYVVKKLSSTTFSLHAYNSSQNGSQGYINPATNFYKVHDAYANDTRISINATNFPEMWHGAPHLPNSGLIKEHIPGGGYVKGTDALRLHIYRGDGVVDGMAYNVYTPVTQGDVITVSYWVKPTNAHAYGKTWNYQTYFGAGNGTSSFNNTLNSTGDWQHVVHQWTASATVSFYQYWFPQSGTTDKYAFDIADLQVEVNKGHATPFVAGTRSSTESLIDLKRTTTINTNNVSFDSSAQPEFDGTDDYFTTSGLTSPNSGTLTFEAVIKFNGTLDSNDRKVFHWDKTGSTDGVAQIRKGINNGRLMYQHHDGSTWHTLAVDNVVEADTYAHIVVVHNATTATMYKDGVQVGTGTVGALNYTNAGEILLGYRANAEYWKGNIPVFKVYTDQLSTTEIKRNYKAYQKRFNI
tara:strand:- start:2554 stop:4107 length:1554 start_codon:yes stop_codon:yes gene_type:complete